MARIAALRRGGDRFERVSCDKDGQFRTLMRSADHLGSTAGTMQSPKVQIAFIKKDIQFGLFLASLASEDNT